MRWRRIKEKKSSEPCSTNQENGFIFFLPFVFSVRRLHFHNFSFFILTLHFIIAANACRMGVGWVGRWVGGMGHMPVLFLLITLSWDGRICENIAK